MRLDAVHRCSREAEAVFVVGDRYTYLLTGAETGGAFALFHFLVPPGSGSPPHTHSREDETFYVLSGAVEFTLGGKPLRAGPGDVVFGPRGIEHQFKNYGETDAEMACLVLPAGLEAFFREAGLAARPGERPPPPTTADKARMAAAAGRYGITLQQADPGTTHAPAHLEGDRS